MDRFIHITTNHLNGMKYIGQHNGNRNDNYLGSGIKLVNAIKKYGKENFTREIVCYCDSQEELDEKEKYYIKKYDAVKSDNFYNIAEGGKGNPIAGISREKELERRSKISKVTSGENNPFYGKGFHKENHPLWGKHHSEESKEKMRQAKLGKKLSEEHKKKYLKIMQEVLQ